ncbi:MAG TPA: hypothetical protein VEF89_34310, partial [Solirubrobacteraceae bacterium]|nr:hypothetical protein [Solirubrobacteraceae bacterium]
MTLPRVALDLHDVLKLALLKPHTERGDIAITAVGLHDLALKPPLQHLIDDVHRQPPLLAVT